MQIRLLDPGFDTNSHTEWQTVQIQNRYFLHQKPTDQALHVCTDMAYPGSAEQDLTVL